jgi:hypothetical protein
MALGVVGASFVVFVVTLTASNPPARAVHTAAAVMPQQGSVAVASNSAPSGSSVATELAQPAAPQPVPVNDGCDLPGAIPNCKEELAKLAAARAAHPELYNHVELKYANPSKSSWGSWGSYTDDFSNNLKAAEASANVRRLAAQNNLDAARNNLAIASDKLSNDLADINRQYEVKRQSLDYDITIHQQEYQRRRRGY